MSPKARRLTAYANLIARRLAAAGLLSPALNLGPTAYCVQAMVLGPVSAVDLSAVAAAAGLPGAHVDQPCGVVAWFV